jgi:hypothetical protein
MELDAKRQLPNTGTVGAWLLENRCRLISPQHTKSLRPQQYMVLLALLENKGQLSREKNEDIK